MVVQEVGASSNSDVPLLALPDELLAKCVAEQASDGSSNPSYLRTCRRFLHLYMRHGSLRLRLLLGQLNTTSTVVQLLAQPFTSLHKLEVVNKEGSTEEQLQLLLLPAPPAPAPQWACQLTHLRVVGGVMAELIPAFLATACPHLKELEYRDVVFQSSQQCQPASLAKLQRLQLHQCQQLALSDQFRDQLQALPSLTDFSYTPHSDGIQSDDSSKVCTAVAESLSARLTQLCVHAGSTSTEPIRKLLANDYSALDSLHLPGVTINDAILNCVLQKAPQATTFQVAAFHLEEDHSSKCCAWKQVGLNHVDVVSLARLPLGSATRLSILPGENNPTLQLVHTGISADMDMDLTAKAVAAVQQCGGLTCQHGGGQNTTVIIPVLSCSEQVFIASIPLLSRLHAIKLHHAQVTRPLLQALSGLLALRMIGFGVGCFIGSDEWSQIPRSLPQVKQLQFTHFMDSPWMLTAVIRNVTNPITLSLRDKDWDKQDKEHLKGAYEFLETFNAALRELVTIHYDLWID